MYFYVGTALLKPYLIRIKESLIPHYYWYPSIADAS